MPGWLQPWGKDADMIKAVQVFCTSALVLAGLLAAELAAAKNVPITAAQTAEPVLATAN